MATIIAPLPITLLNGTVNDATQVMLDLNSVVTQVNANAAGLATNNNFTGTNTINGQAIVAANTRGYYLLEDFGAVGDGVTDDTTAIQNAINQGNAAGGKVIIGTGGKTYAHATQLTLKSKVLFWLFGASLLYTGASAVAQITTPTTGVLVDAGIVGGVLNSQSAATKAIELFSPQHCNFQNLAFTCNNAANIVCDVLTNTTGTVGADGTLNAIENAFGYLRQTGQCGTLIRLMGDAGGTTFVTLNTFIGIQGEGVAVRGFDFARWCDSNTFSGQCRVNVNTSNGVGAIWNSSSPTTNVGVYSNNFQHLAVDTFSGGQTGRIGIVMNWTKLNYIWYYFNDPQAEGGAYSFSANCQSYYVAHQVGGTSNVIERVKLISRGSIDNPTVLFNGDSSITTQTCVVTNGINRTGNGIALYELWGDPSGPGTQIIRNAGASGSTQLRHNGASQLEMKAQTAGGSVGLTTSTGSKVLANDTGIGLYAVTPVARATTAGASAAFVVNAGTAVNTASTFGGYTIAQVVQALQNIGVLT